MNKMYRFALTNTVLSSTLFVSSALYANTIISTPTTAQLLTSTSGNIEITNQGQVNVASKDAIVVDSASAIVTLDANNINPNAIVTTVSGNGIDICNAAASCAGGVGAGPGSGSSIVVGAATGISASSVGIVVGSVGANIDNSGTILGATNAINIITGGTGAIITNEATGTLQATTGPALLVNDVDLTLTNSGLINGSLLADTIQINTSAFTSITNNATGTISGIGNGGANIGSAINILTTPTTGTIENSGLITTSGGNLTAGIAINVAFSGVINNDAGGIIQTTSTVAGGGSNAILIANSFGDITNAGIIQATTNNNFALSIVANPGAAGTITNTGLISAVNEPAFVFNQGFAQLINAGTITSTAATGTAVILAHANNITVTSGITNTGFITASAGQNAIDLKSAGANIDVSLQQNSGTITGNVLLNSFGGPSLTMTGGQITGNVTAYGNSPDILTLSGGTITGTTTLAGMFGNNIVNLSGTSLQALIGSPLVDTYNVSGGSFTSLNGNGGADVLNVIGSFTAGTIGSPGTITNVPTINVLNSGTVFATNLPIMGVNTALTIGGPGAAGASMVANANVSGSGIFTIQNANSGLVINDNVTVSTTNSFTNNGVVNISSLGKLSAATYTQNAGAAYAVEIENPNNGKIVTTGMATLNAGSTVNPYLGAGNFLIEGDTFDIVQSTAGVLDFSTLIQPQTPVIFFSKSGPLGVPCGLNSCVELTAHRNPYAIVALSDNAIAVGATLDGLVLKAPAIDPVILAVLQQIDILTSAQAVTSALESLAPPANYALITSSHVSMDNAFDSVQIRLEDLHGLGPITSGANSKLYREEELYNGVNLGDLNGVYTGRDQFEAWAKVYGSILDQHKRHEIEGFQTNATGLSIGGDWGITPCTAVGVAGSYSKENTKDRTDEQDSIDTKSYQLTFYGWFEPIQSIYIDSMFGIASHKYKTKRNIAIGDFSASASANFYGLHYGAQVDVGYAFLSEDDYFVAPLVRFKYTLLEIDNYSEEGAGGINLSVKNRDINETIAGIGLRLAAKKDFVTALYVPEVSAMILYDFSGQVQEMESTFLGGGSPFFTNSIKPAQTIFLYSLGVTAHTSDDYTFTFKVNFEHRNEFFGYNAYMQLQYTWG